MEIRPVIVGDHADIDITPRISRMDSDDPGGIIRFTGASIRLSVPLGQWVTIAAADTSSREVLGAILAGGSATQKTSVRMSLWVETF